MFKGFREFSSSDWLGWGGACKFKDGSGPFIKDYDFITIVISSTDNEEVAVNIDSHEEGVFYNQVFPTRLVAEAVMNSMTEDIEVALDKEGPIGVDLEVIAEIFHSYGFYEEKWV